MKRLMVVLVALTLALGVGACGSSSYGSSYSGSGSHHTLSKVFCAISVYSAYRDVREHRLGWAAFQALLAHHNCHQAFSRPY